MIYIANIFSDLNKIMDALMLSDYLFFGVILLLIILLVVLLFLFKNSDRNLEWELPHEDNTSGEGANLLEIAREIEKNDEHINIDLSSYEKAEEEASIISYDELVEKSNKNRVKYMEEENKEDLIVRKVDIENTVRDVEVKPPLIRSYEKEEALLAALKQLQKNLS